MLMERTAVPEPAQESGEAYQTLLSRVSRRTHHIPAELLVRHVLGCVPASEWPARVEAMDAVLRRLEAARRDELRIESKPDKGRLLGPYETRRRGAGARPYRTMIRGIDPIAGRCDCPDFLKNSLGLCKHVLTVLDELYSKPRRWQLALKEQERAAASARATLSWDPVRPLTGPGDWLERVAWVGARDAKNAAAQPDARRWFRAGKNGGLALKQTFRSQPAKRLDLVEDLLRLLPAGAKRVDPDPALQALLTRERHRLQKIVEASYAPKELRAAIRGLKRPLYPYQREGVESFLATGHLLLADDMGLGKTAQAIACCDILWRSKRIRRGLIIAPASLKPQWAREWNIFSDLPVQVVDGAPGDRKAFYEANRSGFLIINYEQLIKDLETVRRWEPDLVVLDEAQRIKNWATKTALSVKRLAPPYRLVLTGTPMENRIDELASIVEWVDDMALEPKWRLAPLHTVYADGKREMTGVRHLDTLRERLKGCMVRRVRQEVLDQLPPRTDTRVPIPLTEAQQEEHDSLNQPIAQLMQKAKKRPLTQAEFLRLMSLLTTQRIISNGLVQLRFDDLWPSIRSRMPDEGMMQGLSAPKLLELRQLIRQLVLDQGRKAVIFSQWRRMLALAHWAVRDLLGEQNLRAGFFTGAEGQRRRTQNIVEFHDDPQFRILFASDAGGVGLNLQRAANCVINLELPWNPAVLEQRIGRIYRLGQTQPIDVYNLICEQGIESRIAGLVGSKQAFFKGLFDGDSDTVKFEQSGSFMTRIQKLIDPEAAPTPASGAANDFELAESTDTNLDDELTDPFEQLLEEADEARDEVSLPADTGNGEPEPGPARTLSPENGTVPPAQTQPGTSLGTSAGDLRHLFSQLEVRREASGKVVIEAPAEAASTLSALFEGMAALLQAVSSGEPVS